MKLSSVTQSLFYRILITVILFGAVVLFGTGSLLQQTFRFHIEKRFNETLSIISNDLVAASIVKNGALELEWRVSDPRYNLPLSGWYWLIHDGAGDVVASSDSLLRSPDSSLIHFPQSQTQYDFATGPGNKQLRVLSKKIKPAGSEVFYVFSVSGPLNNIDHDVDVFTTRLYWSLLIIGGFIFLVALVQLRWILKPLNIAKDEINLIRSGERERLISEYPKEIESTN